MVTKAVIEQLLLRKAKGEKAAFVTRIEQRIKSIQISTRVEMPNSAFGVIHIPAEIGPRASGRVRHQFI
jgi:hypothetical protein